VVSASAFMQYRPAAQLMGAGITTVPTKNMKHDLVVMAQAATSRTKLIFIANPNNPTGTFNTFSEVAKFLSMIPEKVLPVFDEAYFEYAAVDPEYPSMSETYFKKRPMVVLRTFSMIYGLAGLRVGYGVAPEGCVAELDKIRLPFNVSIPAQAAALAAMLDVKHVQKSVALNQREKEFVTTALKKLGLDVVPSSANFVLFTGFKMKGRVLFEELIQRGIIARSVDEYGLADHLRITIGSRGENEKFLEALTEVIKPT